MRFNNLEVARLLTATAIVLHHLAIYAETEFGVRPELIRWLRAPWLASALGSTFFAISGFVLTHVLRSTPPARFLVHRFVRVFPGYWLALALVAGSFALGLWPGPYLSFASPNPTVETFLAVPPTGFRLGQYPLLVEWTLIYEVVLWGVLLGLWALAGPRRLPAAAAAWLAVLAVKAVVWPDYGSAAIPSWRSVWVSVFFAPFLLGVLAYHLKDRGRAWRWPVLALIVGLNAAAVAVPESRVDCHFGLRGVAAGLLVWFLVKVPDAKAQNPLVVGGGYSYGLYLLHVPLILFSFRVMQATGVFAGTLAGVAAAGAVAFGVGLLTLGRLEARMHARLKRLVGRVRGDRVRRLVGAIDRSPRRAAAVTSGPAGTV